MDNFDVTSANAQLILTVEDLYPSGVALEMFGTDAALSSGNVDFTETRKGVDGRMVAGVVKNVYPVTITLEAASPSLDVLYTLRDAMQANNKPYKVGLTVYYPATGYMRTYTRGVLKSGPTTPTAQRTLQPTTWNFDFEDCK